MDFSQVGIARAVQGKRSIFGSQLLNKLFKCHAQPTLQQTSAPNFFITEAKLAISYSLICVLQHVCNEFLYMGFSKFPLQGYGLWKRLPFIAKSSTSRCLMVAPELSWNSILPSYSTRSRPKIRPVPAENLVLGEIFIR